MVNSWTTVSSRKHSRQSNRSEIELSSNDFVGHAVELLEVPGLEDVPGVGETQELVALGRLPELLQDLERLG